MSVIELRVDGDINYQMEHGKVSAVILGLIGDESLCLEIPKDSSGFCDISLNCDRHKIQVEGLKRLCIAWLALVSPEVLVTDD